MRAEVKLDIAAQPDDESCGPTCLHALYQHYGLEGVSLRQVIDEIERVGSGGTIAEVLACHALRRGFAATIYTYHLHMFDPTWFAADGAVHDGQSVSVKLSAQLKGPEAKGHPRLKLASKACKEFLQLGGQLKMVDLTSDLVTRHLAKGQPIIAGLSSTFLYRESRTTQRNKEDDVTGAPQGHFVMVVGCDTAKGEVMIADPLDHNPPFHTSRYRLSMDRFINAVMLGILTHDANLLVITPRTPVEEGAVASPQRRQLPQTRRKPRPDAE